MAGIPLDSGRAPLTLKRAKRVETAVKRYMLSVEVWTRRDYKCSLDEFDVMVVRVI